MPGVEGIHGYLDVVTDCLGRAGFRRTQVVRWKPPEADDHDANLRAWMRDSSRAEWRVYSAKLVRALPFPQSRTHCADVAQCRGPGEGQRQFGYAGGCVSLRRGEAILRR